MCLQKIYLRNPVKEENKRGFDKCQIKVQCNKCADCRKQKSNDWLVRSYFEFRNNNRQAFFLSLDFDNQHLPIWQIGHGLVSKKVRKELLQYAFKKTKDPHIKRSDTLPLPEGFQPCFDTKEVQDFLHRLRYYVGQFTYFFASDYGGALKRPHYHMVILPLKHIRENLFFQYVGHCWIAGHHLKIDSLDSVNHNPLKGISYITQYTTKDISFDLLQKEAYLPSRHQSRNQASKRYGYSALECGDITIDDLKNNSPVALPIGKNGKLCRFQIPRYYELKLAYDYRWDSDEKKAYLIKNDLGVEISKLRHNGDYVHYVRSFFASRHDPAILKIVDIRKLLNTLGIEEFHPYLSWTWKEILYDISYKFRDFCEFIYCRPFMQYYSRFEAFNELNCDAVQYYRFLPKSMFAGTLHIPTSDYKRMLRHPSLYKKYKYMPFVFTTYGLSEVRGADYNSFRPEWFNFAIACTVFDLYKEYFSTIKNEIENFNAVQEFKKRTYNKIKHRPDYERYLNRINYDWSQLLT